MKDVVVPAKAGTQSSTVPFIAGNRASAFAGVTESLDPLT
jgi:hypothetical protein